MATSVCSSACLRKCPGVPAGDQAGNRFRNAAACARSARAVPQAANFSTSVSLNDISAAPPLRVKRSRNYAALRLG